jgi:hypothetical protein
MCGFSLFSTFYKKNACSIANVLILKPKSLSLEIVKTISIDFIFEKEKPSYQTGKNSNPKSHMFSPQSCTVRPTKSTTECSIGWVGGWGIFNIS